MATERVFHNNTLEVNSLWYNSHKDLLEKVLIECDALDRVDELTTKLLGQPVKMKKLKDPNKPKRAKTSFIFFCNEQRPKIRKSKPSLKLSEVMKQLGADWKKLSNGKRKKYQDMHAKDKQRYETEMDEYENKLN